MEQCQRNTQIYRLSGIVLELHKDLQAQSNITRRSHRLQAEQNSTRRTHRLTVSIEQNFEYKQTYRVSGQVLQVHINLYAQWNGSRRRRRLTGSVKQQQKNRLTGSVEHYYKYKQTYRLSGEVLELHIDLQAQWSSIKSINRLTDSVEQYQE